jgi:hypothetical protein
LNALSTSVASTACDEKSQLDFRVPQIAYLVCSLFLVVQTLLLTPMMVDGDGLTHSSRAIYQGFLSGMHPKHPLAAALLRTIYLPLQAAGLKRLTLTAFVGVCSLCAVGTFLLLACSIFPRFIKAQSVSLLCALGVVESYGVLSRASTIEVYAPALFLDVALIAHCLRSSFSHHRPAVVAGLLLVLAIGLHVTNLLIIPGVIVLVIARTPRERIVGTLLWGGATFLLGMGVIICLLWLGLGRATWPPDPALILPQMEIEPAVGLGGRLARAAYGFARTVAFLPYHRELRAWLAVPYVVLVGGVFLLCSHLARRGFLTHLETNRGLLLMLVLLATPFLFMGLAYYASDPERWLYLMPLLWLLIGLAWDQYDPGPGRRTIAWGSPILLAAVVIGLGTYNSAALLPDTLANRSLAGLRTLSKLTTQDDLVISPDEIRGPICEFYLDRPIQAENLTVMGLVKEHGADLNGMQAHLAHEIDRALQAGRRVFVFNLIGEGHEKQRGYPWSNIGHDYGPDTFLAVLEKYPYDPIDPPNRMHIGILRLKPRV